MFRKIIHSICLLLFVAVAANAQDIDLLILNRNYNEALAAIGKKLEASPGAELYFKEGVVYEKLMNFDKAVTSFEKACRADSTKTLYWEELAEANSSLGNYFDAINYFQKAVDLAPRNIQIKGKLAQAYLNLKDYEDAYSTFSEIYKQDSLNNYFNRYYAYAAYRTNRLGQAAKLYYGLMDKHSRDLTVYLNMATICNMMEKQDSAVSACKSGLAIFPNNPSLLQKIADTYFLYKNYSEAVVWYDRFREFGVSDFDILKNYGISLYYSRSEKEALDVLDLCYQQTVNDPIINFYMAACYKKLKQLPESVGFFKLAIETATPSYLSEIYHHLGQVYGWQREFKLSIEAYQKSMELDPTKTELLFEIATTYEEYNYNKTMALNYYQSYLKEAGESAKNVNYALDRIKKIKEDLFFEEGN